MSSGHNLACVVVPWLIDEWPFMDILEATNTVSDEDKLLPLVLLCRVYRCEKMSVYYVYQWRRDIQSDLTRQSI